MKLAFTYHPDILARYPNLAGGILIGRGLRGGPTPPALSTAYTADQQAVLARIGTTPLSEIESLGAWRAAFRGFGVDPTQYRSAAEALLRRLTKKGDIPSINTLVDLGNLVSIRYGLPVAVLDTRALEGPITVHFASGAERFIPLGEPDTVEHPEPGEVVFTDPSGRVVARRWCWRQSEDSAARETTTDVIITVEAHHAAGRAAAESALADLTRLLTEFTGGALVSAVLDRSRATLSE